MILRACERAPTPFGGICVKHTHMDQVKKFRAEDLRFDIKTRFKQLFAQAPSWTKEDLLPYLDDLVCYLLVPPLSPLCDCWYAMYVYLRSELSISLALILALSLCVVSTRVTAKPGKV